VTHLLVAAVVLAVLVLIMYLVRSRLTSHSVGRGKIEAVVRVASGSLPELTSTWRHGIAIGSPGVLQFAPIGPGGLRFPRREAFTVVVTTAGPVPARRTGWRTALSVRPGMPMAELTTPSATLEIAARPTALDRLVQDLRDDSGAPG
jgi:hypothetical protein